MNEQSSLAELATLYGVATSYVDVFGKLHEPSPETLVAVLRALGAEIESTRDVPAALSARRHELRKRITDPVVVSWDEGTPSLALRLPPQAAGPIEVEVLLEDGSRAGGRFDTLDLPALPDRPEDQSILPRRLDLPWRLPHGYHHLLLTVSGSRRECLLLSAPVAAYGACDTSTDTGTCRRDGVPTRRPTSRRWGVFLPLYALRSSRSWGTGDFRDLGNVLRWTRDLGGEVVATLPLLASYLEDPHDPSPYVPVSRLFWNEAYVEVESLPELEHSLAARDLLASTAFRREVAELRSDSLVDYRRHAKAKCRVLTELARSFFDDPLPRRLESFKSYLAEHPLAEDYARFRAIVDKRRDTWPSWPPELRRGRVGTRDHSPENYAPEDPVQEEYAQEEYRYHLYGQWVADEQLRASGKGDRQDPKRRPTDGGSVDDGGSVGRQVGLYLDLPLGVHPGGYDTWREPTAFAPEVSAGAPPDVFFAGGQNWGFPPPHPENNRNQGYRYFRSCLRNQLRYARYARIDHVMGLHRLFWIPRGMSAAEGTYVSYPAEELYALLSLESHRQQTIIVGEDLGTVSEDVRPAMDRHGIRRMYVLQYELKPEPPVLVSPPTSSVAWLNTHDMPPFAGFLDAVDVEARLKSGQMREEEVHPEKGLRMKLRCALTEHLRELGLLDESGNDMNLLRATLMYLAESEAELVLANLEDLWLEAQPQNVPGTGQQRTNWRRKMALTLEEMKERREVTALLEELNSRRRGPANPTTPVDPPPARPL